MAQSFTGMITDARAALAYMFAGKAFVTFRSASTGARFTFKINVPAKDKEALKTGKCNRFFVSFLFGQDNERDYRYLGQIVNNKFELTRASRASGYSEQTPAFVAFQYAFSKLIADIAPADAKFEVWHEGRCGRCGRKLTVPESVATGFGPECIDMVSAAQVSTVMFQQEAQAAPKKAPVTISANLNNYVVSKSVSPQGYSASVGGHVERGRRATGSMNGRQVAEALYRPAQPKVERVDNLDAQIRAMIAEFKNDAPENYFQDGMLDETEAFKVAYNMFRCQLQKGNQ